MEEEKEISLFDFFSKYAENPEREKEFIQNYHHRNAILEECIKFIEESNLEFKQCFALSEKFLIEANFQNIFFYNATKNEVNFLKFLFVSPSISNKLTFGITGKEPFTKEQQEEERKKFILSLSERFARELNEERQAREKAEARADDERRAREKAEKEALALREQALPDFFGFLQNNSINDIFETDYRKGIPNFSDNGITIKEGDFVLKINHSIGKLPVFCKQFFLFLLVTYSQNDKKDSLISFPLSKYKEIRGLKDDTTTRDKIKESMDILNSTIFSAKETIIQGKKTKRNQDFFNIGIGANTYGIKNSIVFFRINNEFKKFLDTSLSFYTDIPAEIFQIKTNNFPVAFECLYYFIINYRRNEGEERCNIITVETLLTKCPSLPTYEEVMQKDKKVFQRIITPLIKNLDQLENIGYSFVTPDNQVIETPDIFFKGNSDIFFNSKFFITYDGFPLHPERLTKKQEHKEEANKLEEKAKLQAMEYIARKKLKKGG